MKNKKKAIIQIVMLIVVVLVVYIVGDKWYYSQRNLTDLSKEPLKELEFQPNVDIALTEEGIDKLIELLEEAKVTGKFKANISEEWELDYVISFKHPTKSNKDFVFAIRSNDGEEVISIWSDLVWIAPSKYSVDNLSLVTGIEEIKSEYSVEF